MPHDSGFAALLEWVAHDPHAPYYVVGLLAGIFAALLLSLIAKLGRADRNLRVLGDFIASGNIYSVAAQSLTRDRSDVDLPLVPGMDPASPITGRFEQYYNALLSGIDGEKTPRAARSAAEILDSDAILREVINVRLFQAVPNVLVGIGLLFTFLGLTAALYFASQGSTAGNVTDTQASIHSLLDAASFKFGSSLAALGLSIVFLFIERALLRRFQVRVLRLASTLDRIFAPITVEELLRLQFSPRSLQRSADAIVGAAGAAIANALDATRGSLSDQLRAFLADTRAMRTATDEQTASLDRFAQRIAASISTELDVTLGVRISETFGRLDSTINNIAQTIQDTNEVVLKRLLDDFSHGLEARARDSFNAMADAAAGFSTTVRANSDALVASLVRITTLTETISQNGRHGVDLLSAATGALAEVVERTTSSIAALATATDALSSAGTAAHALVRESSAMQARSAETVATLERIAQELARAVVANTAAAGTSLAAFTGAADAGNERQHELVAHLDTALRASLQTVVADATRITDTLRTIADLTQKTSAAALADLERAVERLDARAAPEHIAIDGLVKRNATAPTLRGET